MKYQFSQIVLKIQKNHWLSLKLWKNLPVTMLMWWCKRKLCVIVGPSRFTTKHLDFIEREGRGKVEGRYTQHTGSAVRSNLSRQSAGSGGSGLRDIWHLDTQSTSEWHSGRQGGNWVGCVDLGEKERELPPTWRRYRSSTTTRRSSSPVGRAS